MSAAATASMGRTPQLQASKKFRTNIHRRVQWNQESQYRTSGGYCRCHKTGMVQLCKLVVMFLQSAGDCQRVCEGNFLAQNCLEGPASAMLALGQDAPGEQAFWPGDTLLNPDHTAEKYVGTLSNVSPKPQSTKI